MGQAVVGLLQAASVELLEGAARRLVQSLAAAREQPAVGDVLGERVLEDEGALVGALELVDELEARQLGELGADRSRPVPHPLQQAQWELATQYRRRLQHPPRLVRQTVDARGEHVLDRLRDPLRAVEVGAIARRAGQLLQEERVALGPADQVLGERAGVVAGGVAALEDGLHHRHGVARAEPRQGDLGGVGALHPGRGVPGAVGAEHEDRRALELIGEAREELLGDAVDPVQVLHHEDDRAAAAAVQGHLQQRLDRAGLHRLGAQVPDGIRGLAGAQHVEHQQRGGLLVHAHLGEPLPHLARHLLGAVDVADAAVGPHDVGDRHPRDRRSVRQAPALEDREALAHEPPPELARQAGLAHSRLADDPHHLPAALAHLVEQVVEGGELALPTDEGGEPRPAGLPQGGAPAPVTDDPVRVDRDLDPAQLHRAERLGADVAADHVGGRLADEDLARRRGRLEARGDVDGVADRRGVLGRAAAELAQHHHPAVEAHPGRERLAVAVVREGLLLEPAPDPQGGQEGAPGMVLVRDGGPDQRHEAVPEELVDRPAVAVNLRQRQLEEAAQQLVHRLRADLLRERRRAHDVAEEHRHLLACTLVRRRLRRWCLDRQRRAAGRAEALRGLGLGPARRTRRPRQRAAAPRTEAGALGVVTLAARTAHRPHRRCPEATLPAPGADGPALGRAGGAVSRRTGALVSRRGRGEAWSRSFHRRAPSGWILARAPSGSWSRAGTSSTATAGSSGSTSSSRRARRSRRWPRRGSCPRASPSTRTRPAGWAASTARIASGSA